MFHNTELSLSVSFYITKGKRKKYYLFGKLGYSGRIELKYDSLNNLTEHFPVFAITIPDLLNEMNLKIDKICKQKKFNSDCAMMLKAEIPKTYDQE